MASLLGRVALLGALLVGFQAPVQAEQVEAARLLDAQTDYEADYSLTSGRSEYHGTVAHAPGRERRDFATASGGQAIILRRDIDQATILWLQRKWYVTTNLSAVADLVGGFEGVMLDRHRDGSGLVAGEECSRWRVTGDGFEGRMWFTRDGILMKATGTVTYRGRDTPFAMELSHLRRTAVDPALFAPPEGFHGIPLNLSALGLGKKSE